MNDEAGIIRRVLEGDVDSFRLIVQRYQRPVVRMIRNMINDSHLCEDIGQEVFLTAYRKLRSFDPARSRFSTWLFTIARNKSLNALKKKIPNPTATLPERADPRESDNPSEREELFCALDNALAGLPKAQRTAFVLAEFESLSYEDIAQIEGIRIGTVKSRINRAKKKLRSALRGFVGDDK